MTKSQDSRSQPDCVTHSTQKTIETWENTTQCDSLEPKKPESRTDQDKKSSTEV